jgi:hypothetical protein
MQLKSGEKRSTRHNTGLAKVAVQCSVDTFVVNQSLVLRTSTTVTKNYLDSFDQEQIHEINQVLP